MTSEEVISPLQLDALDQAAQTALGDLLVRKDLARRFSGRYQVPNFVSEFLLAKYCTGNDSEEISQGFAVVEANLANKVARTADIARFLHRAMSEGEIELIDHLAVTIDAKEGIRYVKIPSLNEKALISEDLANQHDRLLAGGMYSIVKLRYTAPTRKGAIPFVVADIKPIQFSRTNAIDEIAAGRRALTTEDWKRLLIRSIGIEPDALSERARDMMLLRMVPFAERGYNMVELGPRSTGKSYLFSQISPYSYLVSGSGVTVAQMFINNSTGERGLVTRYDAICFDEVANIRFKDASIAGILQDYMESGSFARGTERVPGGAGIVLVGNFTVDLQHAQRYGHLLQPLPEDLRDNTAFMDRLHAFLPGWELPKNSPDILTEHLGFHADLLAEYLRRLRELPGAKALAQIEWGSALSGRDRKAVEKTAGGLLKLLYPAEDLDPAREDVEWAVRVALECRRRVKEAQKRVGPVEFRRTDFAYRWHGEEEEHFVGTPEGRNDTEISIEPGDPGQRWALGIDGNESTPGLYRLEAAVSTTQGSGFRIINASPSAELRQSVRVAHEHLLQRSTRLVVDRSPGDVEMLLQIQSRAGDASGGGLSVPALVAMASALLGRGPQGGLVVFGSMGVSGTLDPTMNLGPGIELAADRGATRILVPVTARQEVSALSDDLASRVDISFYKDAREAIDKALF